MKVPLLWLQDYVSTDKAASQLAASFTQLGLMLDKSVDNDVLDLEHRLDRSDWLSILGCARDLAAFENIPLSMTKVPNHKPTKNQSTIPITVTTPAVRRFQTRIFRGIKVGPSPSWLADRLSAYGIDPVNNIVDITNFVMVEYGQTSHAQDISRLPAPEITLRPAHAGETLTTLLGTKATLTPDEFVLSAGGEAVVIGGIVGGTKTGVTATTTDIILDAGNYDSRAIRSSSRRLKIINESVARNDKLLDPRLIDPVMDRLTDLILTLAGGVYYSNDDYYPAPVSPQTQTLTLARLRLISGLVLTLTQAKKTLRALGYSIIEESPAALTVEIPFFRTDIEVEDDLIADILRISNYSLLPAQPLSTAIPANITPPIMVFEDKLRDSLVAQGLHEHITNSLTTFNDESGAVKLANALSSDQNALRTSLYPGLSHVLSIYAKHQTPCLGVFELGLIFRQEGTRYHEYRHLTVAATHSLADSLATLLHSLGITNYVISNQHEILIHDQVCGTIGNNTYTLYPDSLIQLVTPIQNIISDFAHPITLDISLLTPSSVSYADILLALSSIKVHWDLLSCKSFTLVGKHRNYLLTLSWPGGSPHVNSDKTILLTTLAKKLDVTSKS